MLASRPWLFFGVGFVEHLDSLRSGDRSKIRWKCCPKRFHHGLSEGPDCFFSSLPFFNQPPKKPNSPGKVTSFKKHKKSNELSENNLPSPPQLPQCFGPPSAGRLRFGCFNRRSWPCNTRAPRVAKPLRNPSSAMRCSTRWLITWMLNAER